MSFKHILVGVLLTGSVSLSAQRVSLNDGWQFIRLDDTQEKQWETHNQGTDWSSQFHVEHVAGEVFDRTGGLTDSLLRVERNRIADPAAWQKVALPHTAKVEDYVITKPWQGVCYYRRTLRIAEADATRRHWIEFEGAMQLADIWINGRHAMTHAGGYNTFVLDATPFLRAGDNEITVRLDNHDNPLIPPGKPLDRLDFCYHSGLYRDVFLITKGDVRITHPLLSNTPRGGGILVTYPQVSKEKAKVRVQTEIVGERAANVVLRQTLREWKRGKGSGKKVAVAEKKVFLAANEPSTLTQDLALNHPRLWHPETPNLYVLTTEILSDGKVLDTEQTRIGIRRFEITDEGCFINGEKVFLQGSNRHQEYPYVGNAISDRAQRRDVWHIRSNGFNTVRLGHYPQDPSVLDACDEMGLLVIEPIPGWQYFNPDSLFVARTMRDIRQTIRRDRNHASVLLWETTLNESWPPTWWKDSAVAVAHAEMPDGLALTSGDSYGYNGFDVCYNDWCDADFSRPNNSTKPSFIREYYDYEFGGHYSTSRVTRGDGERALRQNLRNAIWSDNSNRARSQRTIGHAVWSMYDYNRGCCDNICYSGVADLFRLPKYSLLHYRAQQAVGAYTPDGPRRPEVNLATRWDAQSSDTVVVLGNVVQVSLRLDGKELACQRPDHGATTAYAPQFDGGNCRELPAPPFTFTGITFRPGTLEAVGLDENGKEVARQSVTTPGAAAGIRLDYFRAGTPAARHDLLIVYVQLHDAKGNACHDNKVPVRLEVEGGEICGPTETKTEDGIASFLVRTADVPRLSLRAVSGDFLAEARWKLQ
ncbi:MAG: glycoside hydrolase family 2 TIM barrel-domain containing protein [Alloprevotella sp.]